MTGYKQPHIVLFKSHTLTLLYLNPFELIYHSLIQVSTAQPNTKYTHFFQLHKLDRILAASLPKNCRGSSVKL